MEIDVRKSGKVDAFRWTDGDDDDSGVVKIYDDSLILIYDKNSSSLEVPVCEIPHLLRALNMAIESELTQAI